MNNPRYTMCGTIPCSSHFFKNLRILSELDDSIMLLTLHI